VEKGSFKPGVKERTQLPTIRELRPYMTSSGSVTVQPVNGSIDRLGLSWCVQFASKLKSITLGRHPTSRLSQLS